MKNTPEMSAGSIGALITLVKNDAALSNQLTSRFWAFLLAANVIAIVTAAIFQINGHLNTWMLLTAVAVSQIIFIGIAKSFRVKVLLFLGYIALFISWNPLVTDQLVSTNILIGHNDLVCFLRAMGASSVFLGMATTVVTMRRIGTTSHTATLLSLVAATTGVLAQAWYCKALSLSHSIFAHGFVVLTTLIVGALLFKFIDRYWLAKAQKSLNSSQN